MLKDNYSLVVADPSTKSMGEEGEALHEPVNELERSSLVDLGLNWALVWV